MDLRNVAVATMTLVRCNAEEQLLRRSLTRLAAIGIPIALADAGTNPAFTDFVDGLPGVVVAAPAQAGLVAQVQAAVGTASTFDRPYILYTEPDKDVFFTNHLRGFLERTPDDAGVVLAARSSSSFETFPPTQRYVESIVNQLCGDAIGVRGDYSYGPFVMQREMTPHVLHADAQLGWGWRPFVFAAARRIGLRVAHMEGDYDCPADQRHEDASERTHRLRQLRENISGLLA